MTKRIVVTGIGATSALGGTAPENWANLLAGVSGTHTLTHDWVAEHQLPVTFAAETLLDVKSAVKLVPEAGAVPVTSPSDVLLAFVRLILKALL